MKLGQKIGGALETSECHVPVTLEKLISMTIAEMDFLTQSLSKQQCS